ncbi:MAG: outer membrane protein, partial [Fluviibacter sp.]
MWGTAFAFSFAAPSVATAAAWSGAYLGIHGGANMTSKGDAKTIGTAGFQTLVPTLAPATLDTSENGLAAGAQIGFNAQSGAVVYGLEADLSYLGVNKTDSFTSTESVLDTTLTTSASHKLDYLGTVRARLGAAASNTMLVYVTGGLAYGQVKDRADVVANAAPTALFWSGKSSSTRTGFAAGAGADIALSDRLSLRGEYLYYDLG